MHNIDLDGDAKLIEQSSQSVNEDDVYLNEGGSEMGNTSALKISSVKLSK